MRGIEAARRRREPRSVGSRRRHYEAEPWDDPLVLSERLPASFGKVAGYCVPALVAVPLLADSYGGVAVAAAVFIALLAAVAWYYPRALLLDEEGLSYEPLIPLIPSRLLRWHEITGIEPRYAYIGTSIGTSVRCTFVRSARRPLARDRGRLTLPPIFR